MNIQRIIRLTPPSLSSAHIKEKIICIRAHRERIFQVSAQQLDNKLIMHNYGHGGAGWTFLFGCVHASIQQFKQHLSENPHLRNQPIAIIGAGCYGLLTAIMLARKGHTVRIIARDIDNTPSENAAGFFFPRGRKFATEEEQLFFHSFGMESYRIYQQIMRGDHPFLTHGVIQLPAYYSPDIDPGFAPYVAHGLVEAPEKVAIDFGNGKQYEVMEYNSIFINAAHMMAQLRATVAALGIAITQATIETFDEVSELIIFNCAGLGAKKLTGDTRIIPVQGHLITLQNQPMLAQLQYLINIKVVMRDTQGNERDELIYYAPKDQGILGITFIRGQASLSANQHEFDRLLERCRDYFGT